MLHTLCLDVEVIFTIQQILDSFPYLQAKSYSIQINHSSLLKGILLFCGLPEDQLPVVYEVLTDSSNNKVIRTLPYCDNAFDLYLIYQEYQQLTSSIFSFIYCYFLYL